MKVLWWPQHTSCWNVSGIHWWTIHTEWWRSPSSWNHTFRRSLNGKISRESDITSFRSSKCRAMYNVPSKNKALKSLFLNVPHQTFIYKPFLWQNSIAHLAQLSNQKVFSANCIFYNLKNMFQLIKWSWQKTFAQNGSWWNYTNRESLSIYGPVIMST